MAIGVKLPRVARGAISYALWHTANVNDSLREGFIPYATALPRNNAFDGPGDTAGTMPVRVPFLYYASLPGEITKARWESETTNERCMTPQPRLVINCKDLPLIHDGRYTCPYHVYRS